MEIIALELTNVRSLEQFQRRLCLNAFGDDIDIKRGRYIGNRAQHGTIDRVVLEITHECAIDLDAIDRGMLENIETGMTAGEIVKPDLEAAIAQEKDEAETAYPEMARIAREEGLEDVAAWFESLARVESAHADRIERLLARMGSQTDAS